MSISASDLARRLADQAEAVCRHYLSKGHRAGRYWIVGDVRNTPGRSMFVRLNGPLTGRSAAGKWTDAATGEHGDLLDIIRQTCGLKDFRDVTGEAQRFLRLPCLDPTVCSLASSDARTVSPDSARRLFAMAQPIAGTLVETYLRHRGITSMHDTGALRFHPRCYYRARQGSPPAVWPAMIARVTDLGDRITGVHRTWLDPSGAGKALLETPRRAMGRLLGNAVRFGKDGDVLAAGEGIETMLSLRCALPIMPMAAALSAHHLAALRLPAPLRVLYVVRDADAAGDNAVATLANRAFQIPVTARVLSSRLKDFNDDLCQFGLDALRQHLRTQLTPEHVVRFLDRA